MATRTFLQLVNDVLEELREPAVTAWDENDYSTLIGRFVNDAKRAVENAHTWHALRDTFVVPTVAGTVTYAFTGTDDRAMVLDAWNYTTGGEMDETTWRYMNRIYFGVGTGTLETGSPTLWVHNGTDGTGQTQVDVYPIPDAVESLKFTVFNPPSDFDADADACEIPAHPIVKTALALARGERGEDGGISTGEAAAFARSAAADSIALDAAKHSEDHIWSAV